MNNLLPLYDRLLIEKMTEEKTASGIILTQEAGRTPTGKVVAVGQGHRSNDGNLTSLTVQVGDMVLFTPFASTDVGENHFIIREDDILAIIK